MASTTTNSGQRGTVKRQARKYVPQLVLVLHKDAKQGKKTDIESVVKAAPFGFDGIKEFCQWLAASVARMDGNPKAAGSAVHKYAGALLGKLKAKYAADHPDYFDIATSTQDILAMLAESDGIDTDDDDAIAKSLPDFA